MNISSLQNIVTILIILFIPSSSSSVSSAAAIILTSGGVSMGEFDLIRKIMEEEGNIHFWRVKLRPGSPPLFGDWNQSIIWCRKSLLAK